MHAAAAALLFLAAAALTAQPPAPKAKAKKDQDLIQGNWDIVGLEAGGKAEEEKNYKGNTFRFDKDKAFLLERNYPPVEFALALDPTRTPKTIDLTAKNAVVRGVYKLDGDNLTLALGVGSARPTDFATKAGGDAEVFHLRRNRWERYAGKGSGFTADLPGKPEERRREADGPDGKVATTFHAVRHEPERVSYVVSVTQLPARPDAGQVAGVWEATRDGLFAAIDPKAKPTVELDKDFKEGKGGGGYAGREVWASLESADGKSKEAVRARVFVAGDRAYGLAVYGPDDAVKAANVGRLWVTFRVVPDKKG